MREPRKSGTESAGGVSARGRRVLAGAAAAWLWFRPSNDLSAALLSLAGLYALWRWRSALAAWRNPTGAFFGLGTLWAVLSATWSFDPAGTVRDLLHAAPVALAAMAVPVIFDRPGRIWSALVVSAALVTARLGLDLIRLVSVLGWPTVLTEARFHHPYLYTHPNVSSMMAGLCALVFCSRGLAGAPGAWRKGGLALGLALDAAYVVTMASRGPQLVLAAVVLAFPLVLAPGWRARLAAAAAVAAVAFALWEGIPRVNPRFRDRTMGDFNQRDTVWGHSKLLADRRPLRGYGFGKTAFEKAFYENPEQRAPRVPFHYPHAHSYWLMLYFQGGAVGFALWGLGWLTLGIRLVRCAARAERIESGWRGKLRARILPALLGTGLAFILIYGIGDYPDQAIRLSQFCLAGLAVALASVPVRPKAGAA